jgi:hypothetical protein
MIRRSRRSRSSGSIVEAIALLIVLASSSGAGAEERRPVTYDGSPMRVVVSDDAGLELRYIDPPALLREIGVKPDAVLVKGHWERDTLVGEAFVFPPGCPPIAYPIRGLVDAFAALVILGPVPTVNAACEVTRHDWADGSVMRFEPSRASEKPRRVKPKEKPKAKPKPRPRSIPSAPRQQPYQWQQYRWF